MSSVKNTHTKLASVTMPRKTVTPRRTLMVMILSVLFFLVGTPVYATGALSFTVTVTPTTPTTVETGQIVTYFLDFSCGGVDGNCGDLNIEFDFSELEDYFEFVNVSVSDGYGSSVDLVDSLVNITKNPFADGDTGQATIQLRARQTLTEGVTGLNVEVTAQIDNPADDTPASITYDNLPTITVNPPNQQGWSVNKTRTSPSGAPAVNDGDNGAFVRYDVEFCADPIGTTPLDDVILMDVLPNDGAGNVLVENIQISGDYTRYSYVYDVDTDTWDWEEDANGIYVVWELGDLPSTVGCVTRTVQYEFPSPPYAIDDDGTTDPSTTNIAWGFYGGLPDAPGICIDDCIGTPGAEDSPTLGPPSGEPSPSKLVSDPRPVAHPGVANFSFGFNTNQLNVIMTDVTIGDILPVTDNPPSDGRPVIEVYEVFSGTWVDPRDGGTLAAELRIHFEDGTTQTYPVDGTGQTFNFGSATTYVAPRTAGNLITQVEIQFPTVPPEFNFGQRARLFFTTRDGMEDADYGGVNSTRDYENCVVMDYPIDDNPPVIGGFNDACADVTVTNQENSSIINWNKNLITGGTIDNEDIVEFQLNLEYTDQSSGVLPSTFTYTDVLDGVLDFVDLDDETYPIVLPTAGSPLFQFDATGFDDVNDGIIPPPYLRIEFDTPDPHQTRLTFIWTDAPATDLTGGNVYDIDGAAIDPNTAPANPVTAVAPLAGETKIININFKTRVKAIDDPSGLGRAGTYTNTATIDAGPGVLELGCQGDPNLVDECTTEVNFTVREVAEISAFKWVRSLFDPDNHVRPDRTSYNGFITNPNFACTSPIAGSEVLRNSLPDVTITDPDYSRAPCAAQGNPGETLEYLIEITNDGNIDLNEFILYDILPYVGDFGVSQATQSLPRLSEFMVWLDGAGSVTVIEPAGFAVATVIEYSTSTNPCRPEMSNTADESGWQGSCTNDWTATPADWSQVRAFRVRQTDNNFVVPPAGTIRIAVTAYIPEHDELTLAGVTAEADRAFTSQVAWNNYAYRFTSQSTDRRLLTAEPRKVGIRIPERLSIGNRVWIDDGGNDFDLADNRIREAIEQGVDGVILQLYRWDGTDINGTAPTITGASLGANTDILGLQQLNLANVSLIAETVTANEGYYLFEIDQRARGDDGFGGVTEADYDWIDDDLIYSLRPGRYFIYIPPVNFADTGWGINLDGDLEFGFGGADLPGPLHNFISSTGVTPNNDLDDNLDRGIDTGIGAEIDPPQFGVVSDWFDLRFNLAPLDEDDMYTPTGTEADPYGPYGRGNYFQSDAHSDLVRDFGFIKPMAIGNRIWLDDGGEAAELAGTGTFNPNHKNNGIYNTGESFINGVEVELYRATQAPGTDTPLAITTTANEGYYLFPGLRPGEYIVHIPARNFQEGGVLHNHVSSTGWTTQQTDGTLPDDFVDTNPDGSGTVITDNGVDNPRPDLNGISSEVITLVRDSETTAEVDFEPGTNPDQSGGFVGNQAVENRNNDLTVDFAFVQPPMAIGNFVWHDNGLIDANDGSINYAQFNDGLRNGDEPGIADVRVNLYRADADGDPIGDPIAWMLTDENGYYLFDRYSIAPDVDDRDITTTDPALIAQMRDLLPGRYVVQLDPTNFDDVGVLYGYFSSDDPATVNDPGVDNDDNGIGDISDAPYTNGIFTPLIVLSPHQAPTNEPDDGVTPANHGTSVTAYGIGNGASTNAIRDDMSDRTWDFGVYKPMSIGNRVWLDMDDTIGTPGDGIRQAGEVGIEGVTLELYVDNANTGIITGTPILTTMTDADGYYLFDPLPAGRYIVHIAASNFQFGATSDDDGPLALYISSIGTPATGFQATNPTDENGAAYGNLPPEDDNTDHGINPAPGAQRTQGVSSATITLTLDGEPTFETDKGPEVDGQGVQEQNSDLTVDFGFWSESIAGENTFSLGNFVWEDVNNDGIYNTGESGIPDVIMNLYRDDNADGTPDDPDNPLATTTTNAGGFYLFDDLSAGRYIIQIAPENFLGTGWDGTTYTGSNDDPGPLFGYVSSTPDMSAVMLITGTNSIDVVLDGTGLGEVGIDQPIDTPTGTSRTNYQANGIYSRTILLQPQGEPINENTPGLDPSEPEFEPDDSGNAADNNSNLTIDFGVYRPMSIGNRVWLDNGADGAGDPNLSQFNDGIRNGDEVGIDGVTLWLYHEDPDNPGALGDRVLSPYTSDPYEVVTDNEGYYLFDGLVQGNYIVVIPSSNFIGDMSPLYGLASSTGSYLNPHDDTSEDNRDNGIDVVDPTATPIRSNVITLTLDAMPLFAADGSAQEDDRYIDANFPYGPDGWGRNGELDANSNLTVDFGFVPLMSLGNLIWFDDGRTGPDTYNPANADNGVRDAGELGVADVTVELYFASQTPGTHAPIRTTTTDGDGYYLFDYLPPADYVVFLPPSNFADTGTLYGTLSSTGVTTPSNVAGNNNRDHGIDNPTPHVGGISTGTITLARNAEPTNEDPDNPTTHTDPLRPILDENSNLTIDLGFIRPMAIGNRIWRDDARDLSSVPPILPGDGIRQASEVGIDGVLVQLYAEGQLLTDTPIASTVTANGGYYLFDRQGNDQNDPDALRLGPGNYFVHVPASNFEPAEPLHNLINSDNGDPAEVTDGSQINANNDSTIGGGDEDGLDLDENDPDTRPSVAGTSTDILILRYGNAPENELDRDPTDPGNNGRDVRDDDSNLTVDLAFYLPPLSIGNFVWFDDNGNGIFDPVDGELGVGDVRVELYRVNPDDTFIDPIGTPYRFTDTDATAPNVGFYIFDNLEAGRYVVRIAPENFQTGGVLQGYGSSIGNYAEIDNDLRLDSRDSGIDDQDPVTNGIFSHAFDLDYFSEPTEETHLSTVDGIGRYAEKDFNSNMTIDFGFVRYMSIGNRVWLDDGADGVGDPNLSQFNDGIRNGDEVGIDGVLVQLFQDDGVTPVLNPYTGLPYEVVTANGGYYLFDGLLPGDYVVVIPSSNFTGGVLVGLTSSTGAYANPHNDESLDNRDNGIDVVDPTTAPVMSNIITLRYNDMPLFDAGGTLNEDDRYAEGTFPYGPEGWGRNNEADANSNLTVDFGFVAPPLSVGNFIWFDTNGNGVHDSGEPGVPAGVVVNLYRADIDGNPTTAVNAPVRTTTTDASGYYIFDNLDEGSYIVTVAAENFVAGGLLDGYGSSIGNYDDPTVANGRDDQLDNGIDNPNPADLTGYGVRSHAFTLTIGGEPIGETALSGNVDHGPDFIGNFGETDANSNMTIDFGFVRYMSIGNRVWLDDGVDTPVDANGIPTGYNDGIQNGDEAGIGGVTLQLYQGDGTTPVPNPYTGAPNYIVTTDANGYYLFDGLLPGDYVVVIPETNFIGTGALVGLESSFDGDGSRLATDGSVPDQRDKGVDDENTVTNGIRSQVITLAYGTEPINEPDLPNVPASYGPNDRGMNNETDDNSNLHIDFGFVEPLYSLGNRVWIDDGRTGATFDPTFFGDGFLNGDEVGIAGVTLTLFVPDGMGGWTPYQRAAADYTVTTIAVGFYLFDGLPAGEYRVRVNPENFQDGGVLVGYGSSVGNYAGAIVDNERDDQRDNGIDDPNPAVNGIWGSPVTFSKNAMPTNDEASGTVSSDSIHGADGRGNYGELNNNSDLTHDFGFVRYMSIGNRVWLDDGGTSVIDATTGMPEGYNDGIQNFGEVGISNVTVQLFQGDGVTPVANPYTGLDYEVTTDTNGYYLFDGLLPGDYVVVIPETNFQPGGALEDYDNSTGAYDDPASGASREDDRDVGIDEDFPATNGIRSHVITLAYDAETVDEGVNPITPETGPDGRGRNNETDANHNATYDFGFVVPKFSIGNYVWFDENNNAVRDPGELGIANVVLQLRSADGAGNPIGPVLQTTTTDSDGFYLFDNLDAGRYVVIIPESQFRPEAPVGPLANMFSSQDRAGVGINNPGVDDEDKGIDNLTPTLGGIRSIPVDLLKNQTPVGEQHLSNNEDHGPDGERRGRQGQLDSNSDLTLDFGFYIPMSLGNRLWFDENGNGVRDVAELPVPAGVTLSLFYEDPGNPGTIGDPVLDSTGTPRTTTTDANGYYIFDNLIPGNYIVVVDGANFGASGLLSGYTSTIPGPNRDGVGNINADNNNWGTAQPDLVNDGVLSDVVVLRLSQAPTGETDVGNNVALYGPSGTGLRNELDRNSNLWVDFGFVANVGLSLGNRVWIDEGAGAGTARDGIRQDDEPGVDGVTLSLFASDTNGNPIGGSLATTVTQDGGYYLFDDLAAGNYVVRLDPVNFQAGGVLEGYTVSRLSPTDDANIIFEGFDNENEGIRNNNPAVNGILSRRVVLQPGNATLNEADLNPNDPDGGIGAGGVDSNSELTIDFGVYRAMSIGNRVWFDINDDGVRNPTEIGVPPGITLNLLDENGDPVLDENNNPITTTTTNGGYYLFDNLLPGRYIVEIPASNFGPGDPLQGYRSSSSIGVPDDNNKGTDGGDPATFGVRSGVIELVLDNAPTGETDLSGDTAAHGPNARGRFGESDANSDLTVDFGLVPVSVMSLGNRVWVDEGAGGGTARDGIRHPDEPGIDGVRVSLFSADVDGNPIGSAIRTVTTAGGGYYLFDNLPPGNYVVRLNPNNFQSGGVLRGYNVSPLSPNDDSTIPSEGEDDNNEGITAVNPASTGVYSRLIVLQPNQAPTLEGDLGPAGMGSANDENSDLTIDFGVYRPMSVGNRVWYDPNQDGIFNEGDSAVPAGVVLNLLDVSDNILATTVTDSNGYYLFDNLLPGDYRIELAASNFTPGGILEGHQASPQVGVIGTDDNTNKGIPEAGAIRSPIFTLAPGTAPTGEIGSGNAAAHGPNFRGRFGETDNNSDLTVDFAVFSNNVFSLGNRVWLDENLDGLRDDGVEPGIDDVIVNLYYDANENGQPDGSVIATTTTANGGYYRFDNLPPGRYLVELPPQNFQPGGALYGLYPTINPGSPNDDANKGIDTGTPWVNGVFSDTVRLLEGQTPTDETDLTDGDDVNNSDLRVDFGVAPRYDFGDAPVSYGTLLIDDGARHRIVADLYLGQRVDAELDGQPVAVDNPADGDDGNNQDDEDGVAQSIPGQMQRTFVAGTTTNLDVTVFNNTGQDANLVVWFDWNANGTFDPDEGVLVTVPSSPTPQVVAVPVTVPLLADTDTSGSTYARLRLTTDPITVDDPTGVASDGEVEDYQVLVSPPGLSIVKTNGQNAIVVGQETQYTVTIVNSGPDRTNQTFEDLIPVGDPNGFDPATISWTCTPQAGASCIAGQTGASTQGTGVMSTDANDMGRIQLVFDIPQNSSITFVLTGTVRQDYNDPTVINTARLVLANIEDTDESGIIYDPPFGIKVGQVLDGNLIRWTMVWLNTGGPQNATVLDSLQPNQTFAGELECTAFGTSTTTSCLFDAGTVSWTGLIGTGQPNRVEIAFNVTVPGPGTYSNVATIGINGTTAQADGRVTIDGDPVDEPGAFIMSADPAISKVGAPQFAQPGEEVVWTITIWNPSDNPAINPVVTDVIPGELDVIAANTTSGDLTLDGTTYVWTQPTLSVGDTVTIIIITRVRADADVPFVVTNTAVLTGDNFEEMDSSAVVISVLELPATGETPRDALILRTLLMTLGVVIVIGLGGMMLRRRLNV